VRRLAERLQCPIIVPCDVREPGQLEAVFSRIRDEWGRPDVPLHSIAYAPAQDLHIRITDCSQAGARWQWMSRVILLSAWYVWLSLSCHWASAC
jgi:enoyl-[acyl-carrier-protein] reductase (NADH)